MLRKRASTREKQMVLTIDPKHAHMLPQLNIEPVQEKKNNSSLSAAVVCRGAVRDARTPPVSCLS